MRAFTTRTVTLVVGMVVATASCGQLEPRPENFVGTYVPTVLLVTPTGQPVKDVLLLGGSLNIAITSTNTTVGQRSLPASVTGTTPLLQSTTGEAVVTGASYTIRMPKH